MAVRTLSFAVNDSFVAELDQAVTRHRRANADRNCSRATFIREAVARAVAEIGGEPMPQVRERRREAVRSSAAA
ncbi:hypothetical protein LOK46_29710 [Methylobacterium sp. NMS14P]|uniref:hypothetical protein n=1 Tax=Methylobacterium sp. NMS14P TaxID=2894310 RepID=UPI002358219B|nr:hypothetical protein [Methylobacterium sp. NMS14P]WCS25244.1 hypothetical protein LOK46_29710 [Methylobacterium sp. NMS14P]